MNHVPQCIPCFLRRVLHTAQLVTSDEWLHRKLLAEIMGDLVHVDDKSTPAEVMFEVFRRTAKTLGNHDPFGEEKARWLEETLANADAIRARVNAAEDPFREALKLSIAANIVDDELRGDSTLKGLLGSVDAKEFDPDGLEELRESVTSAGTILFLHDSVGELVFDRILLERLAATGPGGARLVSVVRSAAVLGDATRENAEAVGLADVVTDVVDPGLECLGLPISECSTEFRELFAAADLVIAKGQAAYQTLGAEGRSPDGTEKDVWFLFRVKCPVMARVLAAEIGDLLLERN